MGNSMIVHTTYDEPVIPAEYLQYNTSECDPIKKASENDINSADLSVGYNVIADL